MKILKKWQPKFAQANWSPATHACLKKPSMLLSKGLQYVALSKWAPAREINRWPLKPKFHLWQECVLQSQQRAAKTWTYRDESFEGRVADLCRKRGGKYSSWQAGAVKKCACVGSLDKAVGVCVLLCSNTPCKPKRVRRCCAPLP